MKMIKVLKILNLVLFWSITSAAIVYAIHTNFDIQDCISSAIAASISFKTTLQFLQ